MLARVCTYDDGRIEEIHVTWDEIRQHRDCELAKSDWRFLSDQSPSDAWTDYRVFLRDLPTNYDTADEAADAWNAYEKPE